MDKIDLKILEALQADGRLTNVELAELIHLSPSPCLRRVKNLEKQGVIQNYRATIDRAKIGLSITVFAEVSLDNKRGEATELFESAVGEMPNIISCHLISGIADYTLEIVVPDLSTYERVLKELQRLPVIRSINSNFAIRTVKSNTQLPLDVRHTLAAE